MTTNYDVLLEKVRALGMDYRWSRMFVKKLRDDEIAFPVADEDKKRWAMEKGFFPGRIELYVNARTKGLLRVGVLVFSDGYGPLCAAGPAREWLSEAGS